MRVKLTESAITKAIKQAAASGERVELTDSVVAGLRLRASPPSRQNFDGSASWTMFCRNQHGINRRNQLGDWPSVGISAARDAARTMRVKVREEGVDPAAERRRARAIGKAGKEGVGTLASLIDLYGQKRGAELKSWAECDRRIRVVFKPFLARPLAALSARDLQLRADGWPAAQSASAAVRYLRPLLKWAAQRGYVGADVAVLHPPATVRRRDRVLSREELAVLLPVLRQSDRPYSAAMLFMLHTLCRRDEACRARWQDVNFEAGTWTIRVTKNGQPHVVPLPRQAVALLRERMPAEADPNGLIFCTSSGGALLNWDRATKQLQAEAGVSGWTRHDLRRTGATLLGEMGELPDIIEAALNHVSIRSSLAATYNRSRYRPQVAAALQRLADALDGIEAGGAAIVPLRRQG